MKYPTSKHFAFTILDDTDDSTLENIKPIYDLLFSLGIITTKTVWPVGCPEGSRKFFAADTLERAEYLDYIKELAEKGFEIASHGATMESSKRPRTLEAFEIFKQHFHSYPKLYCNHAQNRENLYWGVKRYHSMPIRVLGNLVRKMKPGPPFDGDEPGSEYFWGDFCIENIKFVRSFAFNNININKIDSKMPYKLKQTPCVKYWFSTSDAPDVEAFKKLVTPITIDQLEKQNGLCILSTHLGKGFVKNGQVDPEVKSTLEYLAEKKGWFVPTSDILEYLLSVRGGKFLPMHSRWILEARQIYDRIVG